MQQELFREYVQNRLIKRLLVFHLFVDFQHCLQHLAVQIGVDTRREFVIGRESDKHNRRFLIGALVVALVRPCECESIAGKMIRLIANRRDSFAVHVINQLVTRMRMLHILRLYPKKNFHESNFEYILNYINSNANKNISVQQIAYNLGYNYDYLRQLFVKQMGQTLKSYIMELKIDKVKTYLLTTEYTLDKIAEITGFSSASHMCMTFKKDTGLSPMEFRENDLQKDRRDNLRKFV